jgi:hypothetical protein
VVRDARRILWFGLTGFAIAVVLGLLDNFIDPTPGTKLSSLFGLAGFCQQSRRLTPLGTR